MLFKRDEMSYEALYLAIQTSSGLAELAVGLICLALGYGAAHTIFSSYLRPHPASLERLLPYLVSRLVLPLCILSLLLLSALFCLYHFHFQPIILWTLSVLLLWMLIIRLVTALVREVIPRGRCEQSTDHFISTLLWLFFVTWTMQLDDGASHVLASVSIRIGHTELDLLTIISALLLVSIVIFIALWISHTVEKRLMGLNDLDFSLRLVCAKLVRVLVVVVAVLIALPIVGIDLTVLSVFGGALGVGLGFGLQKVVSSYVSGFIILLDRSVRIGDRLMVDNRTGYVTKMTSRFVVLKSADGFEAFVPNDLLISNTVINQSYTDKKIWSSVKINVAYGTDLEAAMVLMVNAARHPRVDLEAAEPRAYIVDFAASGITLEVGFWVLDPENGLLGLKSDINLAIWHAFKQAGIQVPFPQCEVTLLNTSP